MKKFFTLALFVCAQALAQNAALLPLPVLQFTDANGSPLAGGYVYTCVAGLSCEPTRPGRAPLNPLATYTDATAGVPNANPIVLDSAGRAPIWIGSSLYKIVVQDATGVTQYTADNVSSTSLKSQALATGTAGNFASLGVTGNASVGGTFAAGSILFPSSTSTGRTFTNPLWGGTVNDASAASSNAASQGDGAYAPILGIRVFESGAATAPALYTEYHASAGATGGAYGLSANVSADPGSVPRVVAHNWTIQDATHYWISGCTRASGVATCSIATGGSNPPFSLLDSNGAQHCFYINDTSDTSFSNAGAVQCPTSATSSTVTFSNAGSNTTSGAGGWLSPSHQVFSFELNINNASHDPGHITESLGGPLPVWGFVAQNTPFTWTNPTGGANIPNKPISAGYFAPGSSCVTAGCAPQYTGVLVQDAIDDLFTAGYPQVGGTVSSALSGFRWRPIGSAINTPTLTNYRSHKACFDISVANGVSSFNDATYCLWYEPLANTANSDGVFKLGANGWTPIQLTKTGHVQAESGSSSLPAFGFTGWTNGIYNASGVTTAAGAFAGTSTIDANGGFKTNGATGATTTVTCTAGQHITSITVVGGLVTAVGACS